MRNRSDRLWHARVRSSNPPRLHQIAVYGWVSSRARASVRSAVAKPSVKVSWTVAPLGPGPWDSGRPAAHALGEVERPPEPGLGIGAVALAEGEERVALEQLELRQHGRPGAAAGNLQALIDPHHPLRDLASLRVGRRRG